jgi:hypothetical protein
LHPKPKSHEAESYDLFTHSLDLGIDVFLDLKNDSISIPVCIPGSDTGTFLQTLEGQKRKVRPCSSDLDLATRSESPREEE